MVAQRARIVALEVERDRDIRRASRITRRDIAAKYREVLESLNDRWASKKKEVSAEIELQEVTANIDLLNELKDGGLTDVPQSTDQYIEPAQHGVQDVLNISTEVHVFNRTGQTNRAVYWTVPHAFGKELWLEPWPDDRSNRAGACLSHPTSHFKTYGRA